MNMRVKQITATFFAFLAAVLYAVSIPISKLILVKVPATLMAAFLYIGAGIGMTFIGLFNHKVKKSKKELHLTRKELPFISGMILLDVAAPILLMLGLSITTAANTSLLNNFEIVATSMIALIFFHEKISAKLWGAVALVTMACILLSVEDIRTFSFSTGSLLILLACICWGFENNCTRMLSGKNPLEIVVIKGYGSGFGSLLVAFILKQGSKDVFYILITLLLGFISYGLSIYFYVYAQRYLGAAKTSVYYAVTPFIGAIFSLVIFKEGLSFSFLAALLIMIAGSYLAFFDNLKVSGYKD